MAKDKAKDKLIAEKIASNNLKVFNSEAFKDIEYSKGLFADQYIINGQEIYMQRATVTGLFRLFESIRVDLVQALSDNDINVDQTADMATLMKLLKINPSILNKIDDFLFTKNSEYIFTYRDGKMVDYKTDQSIFFKDFIDVYEFIFLFIKINFMNAFTTRLELVKASK